MTVDEAILAKTTAEVIEILEAPDQTKISLELLQTDGKRGLRFAHPDLLWLGSPETVCYQIVGWDGRGCLDLEKVYDLRGANQADAERVRLPLRQEGPPAEIVKAPGARASVDGKG